MAVRLQTGQGRVIRELGIEVLPGGAGAVRPLNYGISMSGRELEAVRSATGVSPDAVRAMLLSVYDGTVLDLSSLGQGFVGDQVSQREWGLFRGSRCCPECVAASAGVWQLWWRLGGVLVAYLSAHRIMINGSAPCAARLSRSVLARLALLAAEACRIFRTWPTSFSRSGRAQNTLSGTCLEPRWRR
jgi:TniQ